MLCNERGPSRTQKQPNGKASRENDGQKSGKVVVIQHLQSSVHWRITQDYIRRWKKNGERLLFVLNGIFTYLMACESSAKYYQHGKALVHESK